MNKKILIGLVITGILAAGVIYYVVFIKGAIHKDPLKSEDKIVIKAVDLYSLYSQNEDSANKMYLDSVINVFGKVQNIELIEGRYTLTLNTEDSSGAVICEMDISENSKITTIKNGDEINLVGFCNGWLMDVQLDRCKLSEQ